MMKLIAFLIFFSFGALQAYDWNAEIRAGYFYPTSGLLRKIYRTGGAEGELELSRTFCINYQVWGNVNLYTKTGHSRGLHDKTRITIVPISCGLKYIFDFKPCPLYRPYVGIGPSYSLIHIRNDSSFVKKRTNKHGFGFVVKSGIYFDLSCDFVLDLFADYYYQKIHFHSSGTKDIGGVRTGLGIGYKF